MATIDELSSQLRAIVGGIVTRLGLLVWPDANAPNETDVRLYLELCIDNGNRLAVVLGTSSDGQTPEIEFIQIDDGHPFSKLKDRKLEWAKQGYWESQAAYGAELFVVAAGDNTEFAAFSGARLTQVFLVCFAEDQKSATGIVLKFGNGREIWSIPGSYGNVVDVTVPESAWPEAVVYKNVMDIRKRG